MPEDASTPADGSAAAPAAPLALPQQLWMMAQAFMASSVRGTLLTLFVAVFLVIVATAFAQIELNAWNQPFYDALSRKDMPTFGRQLLVFAAIAGTLLVLNVTQTWLNQMTKLKLREGLVRDLLDQWMVPGRAFRLGHASDVGVNPDQRMHEDARHLTELSTDLGIGLLQAGILLVSFVSVLWSLSSGFSLTYFGRTFTIPGYMVWAAILYAVTASLVSWRVGSPLIRLNADRYAREADLRFSLVRVNENIDAVALYGGEGDEKRRLLIDVVAVLGAMRRLVRAATRLTWVTSGYGWFTIVAPILVASPVYFSGNLSFGGLMVAVGAFNQVQSALRWFIDNFSQIADWRATLLRVADFRGAMVMAAGMHQSTTRIETAEAAPGHMVVEGLTIAAKDGCMRLAEERVEIAAGERVLIVGDNGGGKTLLFRTLAGLWPWGRGRIARPPGEMLMALPRRPYLPPGTLREVIAYPSAAGDFDDAALTACLARVGLERLAGDLDRKARWDRELAEDEQQCLAFARLPLHKPQWVLIDEALETLDDDLRRRVTDMFAADIPDAAIIHIGRADTQNHVFTRVLHLVKDPTGPCLDADPPRETRAGAFAPVPA